MSLGIGDVELVAEVGGDVFVVGVSTEAHLGGLGVAVAELARATRPRGIVEVRGGPRGALVGAVVEILPGSTSGDQRLISAAGNRDGYVEGRIRGDYVEIIAGERRIVGRRDVDGDGDWCR